MIDVTAIFSDVGGVLGTNAWDRESRRKAAAQFHLDWEQFEGRHELVVTALETGRMTLDGYLDRTIFYERRDFAAEQFKHFMYSQSEPLEESLDFAANLARRGRYLMAILNNESAELNRYRIEKFGLRRLFSVFFSSCFLGVKKPEEAIYQLALKLTQRDAAECVFIDDRALNLECARRCGMHTVQFHNVPQLQADLAALGVQA